MKKNKKSKNPMSMRCPYCGATVVYRKADDIYHDHKDRMMYVCSRYPECDAYVRVHEGTNIPVGTLANRNLRSLRRTAHQYFDKLYKTGIMSKDEAYSWLAYLIDSPISQAHIGYLGEYYCREVIKQSKLVLERNMKKNGKARNPA